MDELIKVAEDNGIVTVTLNRPDRLNAFVGHMRRDLAEALEEAGSDPHVRVVVITGAGRAFCAGGDVHFMAELVQRNDAEEFARLLGAARRVILAIRQMTKPVIASINGAAAGAGFNLALACDLRIAVSTATFSQSFVKLGFHPDWGGTYFLPRMITSNLACELFFLGDTITAQDAFRLGLMNRVVEPEDLDLHLLSDLEVVLDLLDPLGRKLGDVDQAFHAFFELDERSEIREPHDGPLEDLSGIMCREEGVVRGGS